MMDVLATLAQAVILIGLTFGGMAVVGYLWEQVGGDK